MIEITGISLIVVIIYGVILTPFIRNKYFTKLAFRNGKLVESDNGKLKVGIKIGEKLFIVSFLDLWKYDSENAIYTYKFILKAFSKNKKWRLFSSKHLSFYGRACIAEKDELNLGWRVLTNHEHQHLNCKCVIDQLRILLMANGMDESQEIQPFLARLSDILTIELNRNSDLKYTNNWIN